jgi:hypothetical protein
MWDLWLATLLLDQIQVLATTANVTTTGEAGTTHVGDITQTSIPDEDPSDEIVMDTNVLAEVKLPAKPSKYSRLRSTIISTLF